MTPGATLTHTCVLRSRSKIRTRAAGISKIKLYLQGACCTRTQLLNWSGAESWFSDSESYHGHDTIK